MQVFQKRLLNRYKIVKNSLLYKGDKIKAFIIEHNGIMKGRDIIKVFNLFLGFETKYY